jgi:hypothetical protein
VLLVVVLAALLVALRWFVGGAGEMAFRMHRMARPAELYGKVVDHTGKPVPGAEVALKVAVPHWPEGLLFGDFMRYVEVTRRTDGDGRFSFRGKEVLSVRVEAVQKEGMIWDKDVEDVKFLFADYGGVDIHVPDPKDPVVFRVVERQLYRRMEMEEDRRLWRRRNQE